MSVSYLGNLFGHKVDVLSSGLRDCVRLRKTLIDWIVKSLGFLSIDRASSASHAM